MMSIILLLAVALLSVNASTIPKNKFNDDIEFYKSQLESYLGKDLETDLDDKYLPNVEIFDRKIFQQQSKQSQSSNSFPLCKVYTKLVPVAKIYGTYPSRRYEYLPRYFEEEFCKNVSSNLENIEAEGTKTSFCIPKSGTCDTHTLKEEMVHRRDYFPEDTLNAIAIKPTWEFLGEQQVADGCGCILRFDEWFLPVLKNIRMKIS